MPRITNGNSGIVGDRKKAEVELCQGKETDNGLAKIFFLML